MDLSLREISHDSDDYRREVSLRSKVLREPLGLAFSENELLRESADVHLGAFADGRLVGCLVLTPLTVNVIKMRQVAVDPAVQGLGIGRKLVSLSEAKSRALGFSCLELNARETAVPFYLKLGYEIFDEPFVEVTLPHRKMRKNL